MKVKILFVQDERAIEFFSPTTDDDQESSADREKNFLFSMRLAFPALSMIFVSLQTAIADTWAIFSGAWM